MFITRAVTRKASPWLGVREDKGQSPILLIKKNLFTYLFYIIYLSYVCTYAMGHVWRSESNLWEFMLSFHYVVLGVRLRSPCLARD